MRLAAPAAQCYRLRMMQVRTIALLLFAVPIVACNEPSDERAQPETITDQSGAVFGWTCDETRCSVERIAGSPALPDCGAGGDAFYSYAWGSFIEVTGACPVDDTGWASFPSWGRMVVCEADADCPTVIGQGAVDEYVCHAQFCRKAADVASFDALPNRWLMDYLCFGDRPRFEPFDEPEIEAAIAAACPGESINSRCLSIPEGCADPRG